VKQFIQPKFDIKKEDITDTKGVFAISPLEIGFATTVGNALRRVLLSSLPGLSVYAVEVDGARHEYTQLPGIVEDLTQIVLQIKKIVLLDEADDDSGDYVLKLDVKGSEKEVTAGDIVCPDLVSVVNKDLVICHLAEGGHIKMSLHAHNGRGFVTAEENKNPNWPVGMIAVDSFYSPIKNVSYEVAPSRVGQDARYEKLILSVETNGATTPVDAVALASKILEEHFKLFEDLNEIVANASIMSVMEVKQENKYSTMSIEDLDLSVRSSNCLKRNGLKTIQDLCNMKESELMIVRNLGKKSYKEILDKLAELGLSLQPDDNLKK